MRGPDSLITFGFEYGDSSSATEFYGRAKFDEECCWRARREVMTRIMEVMLKSLREERARPYSDLPAESHP